MGAALWYDGALADPAAGFRGVNLARGPNLGYLPRKLKTQRILPTIFWDGPKFTFEENKSKKIKVKNKRKSFFDAWGGAKDMMPLLGLGGGIAGLPPWIRQCVEGGEGGGVIAAGWVFGSKRGRWDLHFAVTVCGLWRDGMGCSIERFAGGDRGCTKCYRCSWNKLADCSHSMMKTN